MRTGAPSPALLETRALTLTAGARTLVQALNWRVQRGELWCLLGPNGAGKTSLLHALSGLRRPASGEVLLDGENLRALPPERLARLRGLMPQQQDDAFSASVRDVVLLGRTPWRLSGQWDSRQDLALADAALQQVGMAGLATRDVLQLSGGERQRVALASLLAQAPPLMLLDEPLSHQDVGRGLALMALLQTLLERHAVVMSCHDINLAACHATHVLLLAGPEDGLYWAGKTADVLSEQRLEQAFRCRFQQRDGWFLPLSPARR